MMQVGVDCEEISRFRRLPYRKNEKFYRRIFTAKEIEYCSSFHDPYPRFAARFAAKEAAIKALNNIAALFYTDIEVQRDNNDKPKICLTKKKFKNLSRLAISLSMAHSNSHAIAFIVITDNKKLKARIAQELKKNIMYVKKKMR